MKIECPYCGGFLIWDYKSGDIICSSCGLVVDRIVDCRVKVYDEEENINKNSRETTSSKKLSRAYIIYKKILKRIKDNQRELEVDSQAFTEYAIGRRGHVRILVAKRTLKALEYLKKDSEVQYILDNVVRKIPILNSRTDRARIAAALIIKTLIKKKKLDANEFKIISEATGISASHARRLYALITKRVQITNKLYIRTGT